MFVVFKRINIILQEFLRSLIEKHMVLCFDTLKAVCSHILTNSSSVAALFCTVLFSITLRLLCRFWEMVGFTYITRPSGYYFKIQFSVLSL